VVVEFGLKLPEHGDIVQFARRAEALGVDYLFQGEHVFFHGSVTNSLIDLSFAAAATERVKILSAATLVPLYPSALLAKMASSIAVNSGGRFNLGVGVGGDFPAEFEACGVSMAGRGRATDAAVDLMRKLWRGESIGPFGTGENQQSLTLDPRPPGGAVPLWVCGRSSATIARAVRVGDWWMPYLYSLGKFDRDHAQLVELSQAAGRTPPKAALHSFAVLADTRPKAVREATRLLSVVYGQVFEPAVVEKLCIAGTSSDCVEQILRFVDAGADALCFNVLADPGEYDDRVEQLFTEVRSQVHASLS
jgi:alkanesulfonate monooxygenase SsuD/methylene tetrahydromethanopterin reductase-like flavin-dependent oxidoreductase (luciferase family)